MYWTPRTSSLSFVRYRLIASNIMKEDNRGHFKLNVDGTGTQIESTGGHGVLKE